MVRVTVPVPGRPYDVTIGAGLLRDLGEHLPDLPGATTAFVISDRTVADLHHATVARAIEDRGLASVLLLVPEGEEAKSLQAYESLLRQLAGREAHRDDTVARPGRRRGGGPRRVRGLHVHARRALHPGADDADGTGRRRDRGQDGGEPPGGEEPRRDVHATGRGPLGRRGPRDARRTRLPVGAGRGGEVRAHAGPGSPRDARARSRPGRAARRRRPGGRDRSMRRRQGPHRRRGRAGRERSARPQLRSHARPCARAAGLVPGPNPRRGRRPRDGVRGRVGGVTGTGAGPPRADGAAPRVPRDRIRTAICLPSTRCCTACVSTRSTGTG